METFDDTQADALLTGLVEQYSPSREEHPAVTYLITQMQNLGFHAYIDGAGNAIGELGNGTRTLLLLGHIDTVPGYIPVRREGNLLYGRGTVDAKGPLATFVAAATRAGTQPDKRVIVVGAVEEEAATSKGARFLLDKLTPEAVIIGEPSNWDRVTVAYKGRLLLEYTLTHEIAHTAGQEINACEAAFAFWQHVIEYAETFNAERAGMFTQLSPTLRAIRSEEDGFTQTAALKLSFRLPEQLDVETLQVTLRALAGDAQLHISGYEVAFRGDKTTPLARAFIMALSEAGVRPQFKVKSGTSDMNVVGPVWGHSILAYGPGDSTLDHTPHEHIDLNEYHRAIEVLKRVIEVW
ncbi:MAG: [LysW]-lysine hydrolase [Anaerolineae bacterium]|nr:[LysW]-lysine hydrolase [Anaerolineae bacterium]